MSDDVVFDPAQEQTYDRRPANWTRWMPDPIQETPPPTQADALASTPEDVELRLKNSLARLRERAHQEGHDKGYSTGHTEGLTQGIEEGRKQGHEEGYQAGFEAGHTEGREQARKEAEHLAALAQACAASLRQIEADVGQELITLAVRIAEQVVHRTVRTEPETLLAVVDDILRMDTGKSALLQLFVHPDDLELVNHYLKDNPDTRQWRVLADDTITPGGCKARTALGDIDATLEKRWERVISAIGGPL